MPIVPEVVDAIVREGVHVTLILMHAAGELPFDRPDLIRLARGESHVRPIEQVRITPMDGGRVLVVEGEIAPPVPLESLTNNRMIDVNQGNGSWQGPDEDLATTG